MYSFIRSLCAVAITTVFFSSCGRAHQQGIFDTAIKQAGLVADKKLLVVVFINPECPITQKYTLTLNGLYDSLSQRATFVGIIPGNLFNDQKIADFRREFAFKIPVIKDEHYVFTQALDARVYPEVVLLNNKSEKLYSGKIDNWYESIGNYRSAPNEFYLKDAINSYLQTGKVEISSTTPVGCFIHYENN